MIQQCGCTAGSGQCKRGLQCITEQCSVAENEGRGMHPLHTIVYTPVSEWRLNALSPVSPSSYGGRVSHRQRARDRVGQRQKPSTIFIKKKQGITPPLSQPPTLAARGVEVLQGGLGELGEAQAPVPRHAAAGHTGRHHLVRAQACECRDIMLLLYLHIHVCRVLSSYSYLSYSCVQGWPRSTARWMATAIFCVRTRLSKAGLRG